MHVPKKSVALIVSVSIVAVSTVLLTILGIIMITISSERWDHQLRSEQFILADQLAESMAIPVQNGDHAQMDRIMLSAMRNRNIAAIVVASGGRHAEIYAKRRDAEWRIVDSAGQAVQPGMIVQEREIHAAGRPIGKVTVAVTEKFLQDFQTTNKIIIAVVLVLFDLVLAAFLYLVLWRLVVRPLREVEAFAAAVSSGSSAGIPVPSASFFGELEHVRSSIANMVALLEARIAERERAEEELRLGEQKLRLILENAPYAVYVMNAEGKGLYVNRAVGMLTGYDREALLNMNFLDVVHPDDRKSMRERRDARFAGMDVETTYVFRIMNTAGTFRWAENQVVMLPWEGKPAVFSFMQDITERRRAEEALRQSERALAEAQRIAHVGSWELDLVRNRLSWSDEIFRMFGLRKDEFKATYQAFLEAVHPDDRAAVNEAFTASVEKDLPYDIVHRIVRKSDSAVRYVHEVCEHTRDASGKIIRSLGIVHDITESKRAEDAIAESNRNFSMVVSSIATIIWRLIFDDHRQLTSAYISEAGESLLGLPPGTLRNSLETFFSFVHPEDHSRIRAALEEGLANPGGQRSCEYRVRRQDGEWRWFLSTGTAHPAAEGGLQVFGTTEDITDRKRYEAEREQLIEDIRKALNAVSRSQKEWQETFDSITDMISIHDRDSNILRANKAFSASLGMTPQQVINRKCYELMHHGARSPIAGCPHQKTLREKLPVTEELFDEKLRKTLRITTYPYFSPAGELLGSIHITRDVTKEKEREMSHIMTERLASLGQMASGIAHELNNPLESVMICSEILLMKVGQDKYERPKFEKYLKIIDEEVMRCRNITSNMLSFARQTGPAKVDVDVHPVLDKTIDLVEYQGRLRNVDVVRHYGDRLIVRGNEGELRQIFLVIVVNALDAMENRGTLTVETGTRDGSAWIRISDTGPGVPQEILEKIFQPFFTTKTGKGGTGLGLSIAHRLVTAHRGTLTVGSEPGKGAAFTVTLPL